VRNRNMCILTSVKCDFVLAILIDALALFAKETCRQQVGKATLVPGRSAGRSWKHKQIGTVSFQH
jgi:hypothetical protein